MFLTPHPFFLKMAVHDYVVDGTCAVIFCTVSSLFPPSISLATETFNGRHQNTKPWR